MRISGGDSPALDATTPLLSSALKSFATASRRASILLGDTCTTEDIGVAAEEIAAMCAEGGAVALLDRGAATVVTTVPSGAVAVEDVETTAAAPVDRSMP